MTEGRKLNSVQGMTNFHGSYLSATCSFRLGWSLAVGISSDSIGSAVWV
ncbi:hypothetical protein ASAP_0515 [Asaia bogorensis]|uniref:Uncharacterized protein n=1 Tax=Asaia bogorensis TaxID=91915 RepID=A0A060QCD1_9PROT|nr:hypothetical protein ASAP_0515 [Asaia bogorensis]